MMIKILEHTANRIAVIALAALLSAACINDTPDSEVVSQTQIGFTADVTSASWNALTKSSMISTDADSVNIEEEVTAFDGEEVATKGARVDAISQYGSFGTFAYVYPNSKNWASAKSALTPDFMYNIESENIGGQWRPSDKEYYWPAASYAISFFAYSPYMDYKTNGTPVSDFMKISGSTTTGAPVIDYTVPEELANQIDLMTADSTDISCSYHQAVPMNFHHVLSGVRFNAKTYGAEITIRKVEISNVYDHGTLAMDGNAWNLSGTKDDFTFSTSHTVSGSSVEINDASDSLFFMLPQTLPSGAKLTVTYVMNGSENTATADFSGKVWEMGKVYAYNLTLDANVIYYTLTVIPVSMPGDDCNDAVYKVVSTRTKDNGNGSPVVEDVPYTISGLPDGASYKVNGDGTFTVTAAAREGKDSVLTCGSAYAMRNIQALNYNGSTPIDLTTGEEYTNSAEGETANCYVINCAGYYCFPANVMGNGDDGVIKNNSYGISENGYFVDYQYKNGKTYLSNAQLNTTGCKAVLLWEDVKGLIDESTIELTSNHYIRFKTVPRDEITPGNAVIALEGADGTIRWSWHIWCTLPSKDYTYNDPNTGRDTTIFVKGISMHGDGGTTFNTARYKETSYGWFGTKVTSSSYQTKIMDVNLGSVERSRRFVCYSSRNFDFRVTQNISGNSADGTYSQAEKDIDIVPAGTTNTLYQWGRKDPFVSGNISTVASDNTSTYYNAKHEDGTNVFTLSGNSKNNEKNGIFGTYPVQDNDYISGSIYGNTSNYAVNLQFAIQHPMTLISNTHSLNYNYWYGKYSQMTTPVDWFTYHIDVYNGQDIEDISVRYDNALLWGAGYYEHENQCSSVKTIYDPSPAGYKVAVGYCYGSEYIETTKPFDYGNYTNVGFFPATGTRDSQTGELRNMGVRGDFWASSLRFVNGGMDTACGIVNADGEFGHSYEQDTFNRGEALSVRPVGEDY